MKITLCGSIAFFDKMLEMKSKLEEKGHEIKLPPTEVADENGNMVPVKEFFNKKKENPSHDNWIWSKVSECIRNHFNKVEWSDAILVINQEKKGIQGYIGGNTLMEMGLAFHLNKKIFLLNQIPEMSHIEEILGMKPTVINGNLDLLGN